MPQPDFDTTDVRWLIDILRGASHEPKPWSPDNTAFKVVALKVANPADVILDVWDFQNNPETSFQYDSKVIEMLRSYRLRGSVMYFPRMAWPEGA